MKYPISLPVIFSTGLVIFAMFFGAGNLIYPIELGIHSGNNLPWGMLGFFITTALLPLIGFVSMLLFNGNYQAFFERLGKPIGTLLVILCMVIIGPGLVLPRIITLTHLMLAPFLPQSLATISPSSSLVFSLLFITIIFIATCRKNAIFTWFSYFMSPLLLISLIMIIAKGIHATTTNYLIPVPRYEAFTYGLAQGYQTLNLLGALFLASFIITMLKNTLARPIRNNPRLVAHITSNGGVVGMVLLTLMCTGLSLIGMYYGHGLEYANPGELFKIIAFHIFGKKFAIVTATAVATACLSTAIAASAISAEYVQHELFEEHINFPLALALVLLATIPLATAGLDRILLLTQGPLIAIGYPVLMTLALVNIGHKLFGLRSAKTPVAIVFILALLNYYW